MTVPRFLTALALVAAVTALGNGPSSGATGVRVGGVREVPRSIASDCSADVSHSLQAWLRRIPNGSVARLRAHGCYRVETEIVVSHKREFVLDGNLALLKRTRYTPPERRYPHANAVLRLADWVDSRVERLRIRGTNTKPDLGYLPADVGSYRTEVEFDAGLALHGLVRTVVQDVVIRSVWGDGVYLAGGDQWGGWSRYVVLRNVRVYQNGRQGIAINRSRHVLVDHAYIHFSRRAAIDLEPDTTAETIQDIEIRNSDLGSNLVAVSSAGAGRVSHVDVHDNVIHRTAVPWLYVRSTLGLSRRDWKVRDNVVSYGLGSPMPAMAFWNTRGIVVSGNRMSIGTTQSQLALGLWEGSRLAVVSCNVFIGAKAAFVDADRRGAAQVSHNSLTPRPAPCPSNPAVDRRARGLQPSPLWMGNKAPLVRFAQQKLGLSSPTSVFDQRASDAVSALQRKHGWPTTGVVDARVWRVLLSRRD